ncbi:MAG: glycerate kinase, partial [Halanaerobium sp.]|nr:glycerate kinase [Halanaerobium sp.]
GKDGAAYVYGQQKGATPEMVRKLDRGLQNVARVINKDLGISVADLAGAGAAGGLGAGLAAFLRAELRRGIEIIIQASRLEEKVRDADLVITGEGKIDSQTIFGKTPVGVARIAGKYSVPVLAVTGTVAAGAEKVYEKGIAAVFSIINSPQSCQEAMANAPVLLVELGENLGRVIRVLERLKER